jgi:hypothetical protein
MKVSATWTPAGKCDVDRVAFGSRGLKVIPEGLLSLLNPGCETRFVLLNELAKSSALIRRHAPDHFLAGGERALLTQMPRSQISKCALLCFSAIQIKRIQRGRVLRKAGKAFELVLERFACCFYLESWVFLALTFGHGCVVPDGLGIRPRKKALKKYESAKRTT